MTLLDVLKAVLITKVSFLRGDTYRFLRGDTYRFLRGDTYHFLGVTHIDFCTQCVLMTLAGGSGAITNDVLKFRKVNKFESSCIVICFSYICIIVGGNNIIYQLRKWLKV